jgi:hypothetical protein
LNNDRVGPQSRADPLDMPDGSLARHTKCASVELTGMCRDSGGVLRQGVSRDDSNGERLGGSENAKTLSGEAVSSFPVTH